MEEKPSWDPKQVRKAVLRETIQHPLTLLSGGTAIVSALYIALLSGSKEGLLVTLSALGLSVGSWVFNYFFRLDHFVEKYYARWKKENETRRTSQMEGLRQQLVELKFDPGIKAYDELKSAYNRFHQFLLNAQSGVLTTLQRVRMEGIACETYDLGMLTINRLVALVKIIRSVDIKRFQDEVAELDQKIRELGLKKDTSEVTRRRLESLEKRKLAILTRIESYQNALLEIEAMLTRSEECENAIENSILQMPVFSDTVDDQQLQKALASMETTVEAARRVNQKLRQGELQPDQVDRPDDDLYLKAGRQE
ncbi:hypothetical protein JXQ70_07240 [bacterium]|nr:hypothetical protein [bacterium]